MKLFKKANWIWHSDKEQNDEYVDFITSFVADKAKRQCIRIAADSNYTLYINGILAGFGQYADYPTYKVCDEFDISRFVREGENRMAVITWYYGESTQTYIHGDAGLIFEIEQEGQIISFSSEDTYSRLSLDYVPYRCELISGQLGFTYHYNAAKYDGFIESGETGFCRSRICPDISKDFNLRPIERLILCEKKSSRVIQQGLFKYTGEYGTPAASMQYAALSFRNMQMLGVEDFCYDFNRQINIHTDEACDGVYVLVDLSEETAGFLCLDFDVDEECIVDIGYGEHLTDGRCRTSVRGFSCRYYAKKGENSYLNTFRRFGCRYLQAFFHTKKVSLKYVGIRPTIYPVKKYEYQGENILRRTIYDVCINTLVQCMHEHYEDCPWREQALYTMDSRNQMLCGYYAFGEYKFARASLKLISKGLREDGLLSLCYPAGKDYPIPSFSTVYFIQMYEYIKYSKDKTLAEECFPVLERIIQTFISHTKPEGYIENFYGYDSKGGSYWNFYEWTPTMDGSFITEKMSVETPLNAFYSLALQYMAKICIELGREDDAEKYISISKSVNLAIEKHMYNEKNKLFESFDDRHREKYSVLTNALCLLCGAAENVDCTNIFKILENNGPADTGLTVFPNTLSMNSFRFDALLRTKDERYCKLILDEIDRDYLYMLRNGATTFWETIHGENDFGSYGWGAGSLCHGWSALPIYYYAILDKNR